MKNFKLIFFSQKDKQDLMKGCLYFDYDEADCIEPDVCTKVDNNSDCISDICGTDNSSCTNEDVCITDNSSGECWADYCNVDSSDDSECTIRDTCNNDQSTDDSCYWDTCFNDSTCYNDN